MKYGRLHESDAVKYISNELKIEVNSCGFFVKKEEPYLGATPDVLIGDDGILEIKCPSSCAKCIETVDLVIAREAAFSNVLWSFNSLIWKILGTPTKFHLAVFFILHINKSIPISLEEKWRTDKKEFQIFTDGSKTDKGSASAVCVLRHGFIHHNWWANLDDNNSVFQADMVLLREATRWLSQESRKMHYSYR
ncbi:hypothetical protein AVEN_192513-1 [Araneus ventricosus]|uniref:YqaJ viral recombinase domain-containing protein n=1 Tax=Araneus ventricosus TaxID=182803 RepID=A0A4Y2THD3_ARAVE|nr:hypothetical protein AVEN_192513-1 [Araneus ventricosus]